MLPLNEPVKTRSLLNEKIWSLYGSDHEAFVQAATAYFNKTYPRLQIHSFDYDNRLAWLVDK